MGPGRLGRHFQEKTSEPDLQPQVPQGDKSNSLEKTLTDLLTLVHLLSEHWTRQEERVSKKVKSQPKERVWHLAWGTNMTKMISIIYTLCSEMQIVITTSQVCSNNQIRYHIWKYFIISKILHNWQSLSLTIRSLFPKSSLQRFLKSYKMEILDAFRFLFASPS